MAWSLDSYEPLFDTLPPGERGVSRFPTKESSISCDHEIGMISVCSILGRRGNYPWGSLVTWCWRRMLITKFISRHQVSDAPSFWGAGVGDRVTSPRKWEGPVIISSTGGGEGLLPIRPTYSPPPLSHAPNDLHRARAAPYTHLLPPSPLEPLPSAQH
jgi:hypothetical protein